jgi:hypothetical protein
MVRNAEQLAGIIKDVKRIKYIETGDYGMVKQNRKPVAKKWAISLMAAAMVVGLAGCGGNKENNTAAVDQDNFNNEGLPIVNEPVTLKVLTVRWGSMGDTFTKNRLAGNVLQ